MSTNLQKNATITNIRETVIRNITSTLELMKENINMYHLLDFDIFFDNEIFDFKEINDELVVKIPVEDLSALTLLNNAQHQAYDLILLKLFSNQQVIFLLMD